MGLGLGGAHLWELELGSGLGTSGRARVRGVMPVGARREPSTVRVSVSGTAMAYLANGVSMLFGYSSVRWGVSPALVRMAR